MLGSITLASLLVVAGTTLGEHEERKPSNLTLEQHSGDEIEKLKSELHLPGPEARQKRESAVAALLGMKAPEAHRALQDVLEGEEDPDDVIPAILAQLLPRLQNERDPVFGEPGKQAGAKVRQSYLRPLILLAGARQERPPEVTERALEALRQAYKSWDRVPEFRTLLGGPDRMDRLAAARAAGRCRDLGLARVLGEYLGDADSAMQTAVADSLRRLTFRRRAFASKAELDAWFDQIGSKSYVDLLEQRAVEGERELSEARVRQRSAREKLVLELIESYVRRPEIQWKKIEEHVLGDAEFTAVGLDRVRQLLAGTETLTGSTPDRLALFDRLEQRLQADDGPGPEECALILEVCAYLVVPGEPQSAVIVEQLVKGLSSDHRGVRLAALSGLSRHPSERCRREVVAAARAALAGGDGELDMLRAALGTLHARDWYAPLPDAEVDHGRAAWVQLLNDVIRRHELPLGVREEALQVLDLRDGNQARVAQGFDLLLEVVQGQAQDAAFRETALIQLQGYVTDAKTAERYVELLEQCLSDPSKEIRGSAAERIDQVPSTGDPAQLDAWTARLVEIARTRLLLEPDADVHRRLADSMRLAAARQLEARGDNADGATLAEQLRIAAEELAAASAEQNVPFRRKNIAAALSLLASRPDVGVEFWVGAGEALLALNERDAVRNVLDRHAQNQTLDKPGTSPEWIRRANLLTINTALRRGRDVPWSDPANQAEARSVLDVVARLAAAGTLPDDPAITLLRMEIHGDLGEEDKVIELAATLPTNGDNHMTPEARQRAALRAATAHLGLGQPKRSYEWLMGLSRNGTVPGEVLDLLEMTAGALLAAKAFDEASIAGAVLVQHTPEGSPRFRARLLLHSEAQLASNPDNKDTVRSTLQGHRALFEGDGVPAEMRQKFEVVLARASNG